LNDFAERVTDVVEVEVQTQSRGGADDAAAIEGDKLAIGEQLHVPKVMAGLKALFLGERGE
jgi:hypothetical protein